MRLASRRVLQLRTLALLALQLQLLAELFETLGADPPEMAQLEIHHSVRGGEGIRQQSLEPFELLLSSNDRAFLLLELVQELETLSSECLELSFDASAVPIQLQELLSRLLVLPLQ